GTIDLVMEREYFGVRRHQEKYKAFDNHLLSNKQENFNQNINNYLEQEGSILNRIEFHLNRLRGPGIGYDRGEYDRVVFLPKQFNSWLVGIIRWCDGLDLRMRESSSFCSGSESSFNYNSGTNKSYSRWEELVIHHRSRQSFNTSSSPLRGKHM